MVLKQLYVDRFIAFGPGKGGKALTKMIFKAEPIAGRERDHAEGLTVKILQVANRDNNTRLPSDSEDTLQGREVKGIGFRNTGGKTGQDVG